MTSNTPLSFATIGDTFKALMTLLLTMSGALGVIGTAGWWIIQPRLEPYLNSLDAIAALAVQVKENDERITAIASRIPEIQVLEFQDVAEVEPDELKAGGRVTITYVQRRNFSCPVTVEARFYSVNSQGFDVSLGYTFTGVRAPVSDAFAPFSIVLTLPANITPGRWGYSPEIVPDEDCPSTKPVYPPPAYFTVEVAP